MEQRTRVRVAGPSRIVLALATAALVGVTSAAAAVVLSGVTGLVGTPELEPLPAPLAADGGRPVVLLPSGALRGDVAVPELTSGPVRRSAAEVSGGSSSAAPASGTRTSPPRVGGTAGVVPPGVAGLLPVTLLRPEPAGPAVPVEQLGQPRRPVVAAGPQDDALTPHGAVPTDGPSPAPERVGGRSPGPVAGGPQASPSAARPSPFPRPSGPAGRAEPAAPAAPAKPVKPAAHAKPPKPAAPPSAAPARTAEPVAPAQPAAPAARATSAKPARPAASHPSARASKPAAETASKTGAPGAGPRSSGKASTAPSDPAGPSDQGARQQDSGNGGKGGKGGKGAGR